MELLSPAGDIESGYGAFAYGADAVYLGLKKFSARATALNFTKEQLIDFTGYAHSLEKKVYVTLNTLLQSKELEEVYESLNACLEAKVDALIIQDLGLAVLVKRDFPELVLHASTQMAVHNLAGAVALKKAGFSRVVLARELSLSEIREISENAGVETEVFIHGALCYSYSGLCLFSSMMTGKSANRGKCTYPCRLFFEQAKGKRSEGECLNRMEEDLASCEKKALSQSGHLFSMKDLALKENILKMRPFVTSLKIEGRKKAPLYVAAVTDYYRRILDTGRADKTKEDNIRKIFARHWTQMDFLSKDREVTDKAFVGHRGMPAGFVEQVSSGRLFFRAQSAFARHDGLQIDVPGQERPFGFSVERIKVGGKDVFEVGAGQKAEVFLPKQHPFIEKGLPIYVASSTMVKGAYPFTRPKEGAFLPKTGVTVRVELSRGKITALCQEVVIERKGEFEKASDVKKMEKAVYDSFNKTGGTAFYLEKMDFLNPEGLFVPVSLLNDMRRELYEKIVPAAFERRRFYPAFFISDCPKGQTDDKRIPGARESGEVGFFKSSVLPKRRWIVRTDRISALEPLLPRLEKAGVEEIGVLLSGLKTRPEDIKALPKKKVRLCLPPVCRREGELRLQIEAFLSAGYKKWEISNVSGFELLPEQGIDLASDSFLYVMNPAAALFLKEHHVGRTALSLEDDEENIKKLLPSLPVASCLTVYQDVPLFLSAHCLQSKSCAACRGAASVSWIKKGEELFRVYTKDCLTTVTKKQPFVLPPEALSLPADYFRIDFINRPYDTKEMAEVLDIFLPVTEENNAVASYRSGTALSGYTGNFKRGLE